MHRHRRCVQLIQDFTPLHGYEVPDALAGAGLEEPYRQAMDAALAASSRCSQPNAADSAGRNGRGIGDPRDQYLLPLGTRVRAMFKMDFAEALYISELRSAPQGHFAYRRVAWEMYHAVRQQHPGLARYFRVTDVAEPVDLLKR